MEQIVKVSYRLQTKNFLMIGFIILKINGDILNLDHLDLYW